MSGTSIPGPTLAVRVNANGQLGTATAASAPGKAASRPLSATAGRRLLAEVKRQQREIRRQGKALRELRAKN